MAIGIWFSFNGVGQIVGGLVAYGIAVGARKHGLAIEPWKVVFLAFGLFTACLGFLFWYIMPDNQLNARWLSKSDRVLAIARIRQNQQGIGTFTSFIAPRFNIVRLTTHFQAISISNGTNSKKLFSILWSGLSFSTL